MPTKVSAAQKKHREAANEIRKNIANQRKEIEELTQKNAKIRTDPEVDNIFKQYLYYVHPLKDPEECVPLMKESAICKNNDRIYALDESISASEFILKTFYK